MCLRQTPLICSDLQLFRWKHLEESHNFNVYICILGKGQLNSFMWKECSSFSSPAICLLPFITLTVSLFYHFSLNSFIAASFNILPVIYFCPYLEMVQSASVKLSFPLTYFLPLLLPSSLQNKNKVILNVVSHFGNG